MRWPDLVPDYMCRTPIKVQLTDGINEDGSPKQTVIFDGYCNYSEKSKQILNAERQLIQLQASALLNGDISPGKDLSGDAIINDGQVTRRIYSSSRGRNPDGSVNFTRLDLM